MNAHAAFSVHYLDIITQTEASEPAAELPGFLVPKCQRHTLHGGSELINTPN